MTDSTYAELADRILGLMDSAESAEQVYEESGLDLTEMYKIIEDLSGHFAKASLSQVASDNTGEVLTNVIAAALLRGVMLGAHARNGAPQDATVDISLPPSVVTEFMAKWFAGEAVTISFGIEKS